MKKLIPVLRKLFELKTNFNNQNYIPYEDFTYEKYKGQDIIIDLKLENTLYSLDIKVPLLEDQNMRWSLSKFSNKGTSWDLIKTGNLISLNEIKTLVNDIESGKIIERI